MFSLRPVDESFFVAAPLVLREEFAVPRPAEAVWEELTADGTLSWCRIIQRVEWTSPRPFGVGTTRTVRALGGTNVMHEHFFLWEEGRRMSFYANEANVPLFRRFGEDYRVEAVSDRSCRLTWTIAIDAHGAGAATDPSTACCSRRCSPTRGAISGSEPAQSSVRVSRWWWARTTRRRLRTRIV